MDRQGKGTDPTLGQLPKTSSTLKGVAPQHAVSSITRVRPIVTIPPWRSSLSFVCPHSSASIACPLFSPIFLLS
ncbi:hypothetical protein SBV1_1250008 [Verrucomicrobia bacterium]|nr:hypothetical protein SBV1_1250008 [Verrucomicrobiota bacterium]